MEITFEEPAEPTDRSFPRWTVPAGVVAAVGLAAGLVWATQGGTAPTRSIGSRGTASQAADPALACSAVGIAAAPDATPPGPEVSPSAITSNAAMAVPATASGASVLPDSGAGSGARVAPSPYASEGVDANLEAVEPDPPSASNSPAGPAVSGPSGPGAPVVADGPAVAFASSDPAASVVTAAPAVSVEPLETGSGSSEIPPVPDPAPLSEACQSDCGSSLEAVPPGSLVDPAAPGTAVTSDAPTTITGAAGDNASTSPVSSPGELGLDRSNSLTPVDIDPGFGGAYSSDACFSYGSTITACAVTAPAPADSEAPELGPSTGPAATDDDLRATVDSCGALVAPGGMAYPSAYPRDAQPNPDGSCSDGQLSARLQPDDYEHTVGETVALTLTVENLSPVACTVSTPTWKATFQDGTGSWGALSDGTTTQVQAGTTVTFTQSWATGGSAVGGYMVEAVAGAAQSATKVLLD